MYTKRFNTFSKRWIQFRVGAISRLPIYPWCKLFVSHYALDTTSILQKKEWKKKGEKG